MGKKSKVGKDRKDKFYKLAKETGFRSRAAFKLIQLNRRFGFLQSSQVCIDLCAAPGGWMQVAKQNMPVSSIVIGLDLYPIKTIPGCISLVEDITTDKCKTTLTRELQTWKADVVLHDGAPNVGKNWLYDAYQQICLTLNALKLATNFLKPNGWFVTKVFRSKDYNALMWVLKQLFKKVHATKPSASRKESAEIFVVCQGYIAPDHIDPKFLDSKYVFEDLELDKAKTFNLVTDEKKKIKAEGYSENDFIMRHELLVSKFIESDAGLNSLQGIGEIIFDEAKIKNHPKTTLEIIECCRDIKVLGRKDLKNLLVWWKQLHEEFHPKVEKEIVPVAEESAKPQVTEEQKDFDEMEKDFEEMEKHIADMELEELQESKRKKKKAAKMRTKLNEKLNLKMVLKYDEGPQQEDEELFNLTKVKSNLSELLDQTPDDVVDSGDEIELPQRKYLQFDKGKEYLDDDGRFIDQDNPEEDESELEMESDYDETGLGLSDGENPVNEKGERKKKRNKNSLIQDLDYRDKDAKRRQRVDLWFDKDALKNVDEDEDEDRDLDKLAHEYKSKGVKVLGNDMEDDSNLQLPLGKKARRRAKYEEKTQSSSDDSSDEEVPDDEDVKPDKKTTENPKQKWKLTEEELALGALLVSSKKTKRDLYDAAWNRYAFNDENLPDWFVKDEYQHMRKEAPTPKELIEEYKKNLTELNVRPMKKVMEAKARKKRRAMRRLDKAKRKAESVLENTDASAQEKIRQIKKLYKKAEDKKKEVTYVVAKKGNAAKRVKRPSGVKGRFKVVDFRMKKDTRAKKVAQKRQKSTKKRR